MIGLDTNVLARYYVDDASDDATRRQREAARSLIESGRPLMVCRTVVLELEWVLRGYYGFEPAEVLEVLTHLLALAHVTIEDRDVVGQAVESMRVGLDFADALHHASYRGCDRIASFDDRRFGRRAGRLGMSPGVFAPGRLKPP